MIAFVLGRSSKTCDDGISGLHLLPAETRFQLRERFFQRNAWLARQAGHLLRQIRRMVRLDGLHRAHGKNR
jgi:hypothetical protein